jgi:4-nitrophenyl phosphatase
VTVDLLESLVDRLAETRAWIAHPTVQGQLRPPVLFSRELFAEIGALARDQGGREVVHRHSDRTVPLPVARAEIVSDIDVPADYRMLLEGSVSNGNDRENDLDLARVAAIDGLIVDMDGVLWHSDTPLAGLQEFFQFLRSASIRFILATNNSSLMPEQYSGKLARFGVEVPCDQILTSAQATSAYVAAESSPGTRVYVIGGDGIRSALQSDGLVLADTDVEWVVVGWDRELTWRKLETASLLIHHGARFVGTNPDRSYPTERGPAPGNGAQLAAIEATTGVSPIVVGKPEPWLYEQAVARLGSSPATTAVVGDRLETDIAGGIRAGLTTILVLSGIAGRNDAAKSPWQPDVVLHDIRELVAVWRAALAESGSMAARAGH